VQTSKVAGFPGQLLNELSHSRHFLEFKSYLAQFSTTAGFLMQVFGSKSRV